MDEVVNCAAYRFARLSGLEELRRGCYEFCAVNELKGTVLLSPEGVNMFVAGSEVAVAAFLDFLRMIPGLEALRGKFSKSAQQPFRRMLVRVKKEIISFGIDEIEPELHTSPRLEARVLKQWLDEGRDVVLLDTRNDYEVKLGTFVGAEAAGVDIFREFPEAAKRLPEVWKKKEVVTFCTGGIRCEKAAPYLESLGFEKVWQLEGGILKYFEECGDAHYEGECFVFDRRVGVDPELRETTTGLCFACQESLTAAEMAGADFKEGEYCPHCRISAVDMLRRRNEALRKVTHPLPGSTPEDNFRPLRISAAMDGRTVDEVLVAVFPQMDGEARGAKFAEGAYVNESKQVLAPTDRVRAGGVVMHVRRLHVEPDVDGAIEILHEEEAFVVVHKPAPLPMHPAGRFDRNTLSRILEVVYAPERLRPVHRLDANTTGVVIFARTRRFAGLLQRVFAEKMVEKVYVTRVNGHPVVDEFECDAALTDEPGPFGSREVAREGGREALTRFRTLKRFGDGTALLEVRPITGRTHQIRLHLQLLGLSICGDPLYVAGGLGEMQTLPVGVAPLCLHAWRLGFPHPVTGEFVSFEASVPEWVGEIG